MLRYSVNLGMLFTNVPLLERFAQARAAGFGAVELFWPDGVERSALIRAKERAQVDVALFNMYEGAYERGERGFAGDPHRRQEWREQLDAALVLAGELGCERFNVLAGDRLPTVSRAEQVACMVANLRWAAPRAQAQGVTILVEPLNRPTHPTYLCQRTDTTLEILDQVGAENVALQYDIYQAQRSEGDIVPTIRAHINRIGHVQVGDAPDRFEPGSGELNYPYILAELDATGYSGFVGLEYRHRAGHDPFAWLPRSHRG